MSGVGKGLVNGVTSFGWFECGRVSVVGVKPVVLWGKEGEGM